MLTTIWNKRKALTTARALVDEGRWRELLDLHAASRIGDVDAALLPLILLAALELEDERYIREIVDHAQRQAIRAPVALGLVGHLINSGRTDEAWHILRRTDPADTLDRFVVLCHRIARKTQDRAIASEAMQRYKAHIQTTGNRVTSTSRPAVASRYTFAAETGSAGIAAGNIRIMARSGVKAEHIGIFNDLLARFDRNIARGKPPTIVRFDDVFVNRIGQIWRPDGSVVHSTRPLPPASRWADAPHLPEACLSTNATKGFYHWYVEHFARLAWRIGPEGPSIPILLGTHAPAFVDETLRLAGCERRDAMRIDIARCDRLHVPQTNLAMFAQWGRFHHIYDTLRVNAAIEAGSDAVFPSIYISRRDTDRRPMGNEAALEAELERMGVVPVILSKMPLARQIHLIANARLIIAPHGAGLSHIINAPPGLKILELMPVQSGSHALRFNFARLSRVRGHDHTLWLEPINPASGHWEVDIPSIIAIARSMLG